MNVFCISINFVKSIFKFCILGHLSNVIDKVIEILFKNVFCNLKLKYFLKVYYITLQLSHIQTPSQKKADRQRINIQMVRQVDCQTDKVGDLELKRRGRGRGEIGIGLERISA